MDDKMAALLQHLENMFEESPQMTVSETEFPDKLLALEVIEGYSDPFTITELKVVPADDPLRGMVSQPTTRHTFETLDAMAEFILEWMDDPMNGYWRLVRQSGF